MPAPHRCFTAVTAVSFTLVDSPDIFNNPEVVANGFSSFPQVISMSPEAKKISIGDTLESINGLSFKKYFELNQFKSGGANNSGGHRAALKLLSFRSGLLYPMPTEDLVKLTLKSAASGKSYSVTLPWIAASRDACIEEARPVINGEVVAPKPPPKHSYAKKQPLMDHPFQRDYDDSFQKMETSFKMTPTKDPIISWGIYAPKNLGIIYMDSFMPLDSDGEKVFLLIRDLLVNQLKDTSALVFDIRDNG